MIPVIKATIANAAYIHNNFGSTISGRSAKLKALLMADVKRNNDITTDFIDDGAWVNAYSRPVIDANISEIAIKKYEGICQAALISLNDWHVGQGLVE